MRAECKHTHRAHFLTDCRLPDCVAGSRTFVAWSRYRYGVFSESGFKGDRLYPAHFMEGPEEKENDGCSSSNGRQDHMVSFFFTPRPQERGRHRSILITNRSDFLLPLRPAAATAVTY